MKQLISISAFALLCLAITSCGDSQTLETQKNNVSEVKKDSINNTFPSKEVNQDSQQKNKNNESASTKPNEGTITEIVNGDLKCYVTLVDKNGKEHNLGATFEVCEKPENLLNNKVRLSYEEASVSDCESAEPCGKSKIELLISKIEILEKKSSSTSNKNDSQTLSNGEWTITIGNHQSWSGVNGTGNLSYRGCDSQDKCIELTGGKVTCRDGTCTTGWRSGDYTYVMKQSITGEEREPNPASTILEVRNNYKPILTAKGFKIVS